MSDGMKCDFCCGPYVVWAYTARPFSMLAKGELSARIEASGGASMHSFSACWAACRTCKGLVERGDLEGLVLYTAACARDSSPTARGALRAAYEVVLSTRDAGRPVSPDEAERTPVNSRERRAVRPEDFRGLVIEARPTKILQRLPERGQ